MKLKSNYIIIMLLLMVSWSSQASDNPCARIQFQSIEAIESQGLLGTLTPDPDPDMTVDIAHEREISISWRGVEGLRRRPGVGYVTPQAGRMQLYELCQEANRRGVRQINIICRADTGTTTSWSSSSNKTTEIGFVSGECFLSSWTGDLEDLDEHKKHQIGRAFSTRETRFPASARRNRYDAISHLVFRTNIYGNLIYQAINSAMAEFRPPAPLELSDDSDITVSPGCAPPPPDPFADIQQGFGMETGTMTDEQWDRMYGDDFWQRTWGGTEWRVNGRVIHRRESW